MQNEIKIERDDLSDGQLIKLLAAHREDMLQHSPPGSVHALDISALHKPGLIFWRATIDGHFAACGGLKQLDQQAAEIKSMKTASTYVRRGLAKSLLQHMIQYARDQAYHCLYLETGSTDVFIPARSLYLKMGFIECPPFADYNADPHSVFMRLNLL